MQAYETGFASLGRTSEFSRMLKMLQKSSSSGSSPDFWEENWEASHFEQSVKFCSVDPLRPLFEKYSRPGSLMLEGGCGMGQYLAFYNAKKRRVVGLDFAQQALKTIRKRLGQLPLCGGDVSSLPFADETFDLYYSGGVVEHFEGGAESSLLEACRVLKKDGYLLISVPYFSPLRSILYPFKKDNWKKVEATIVEEDGLNSGKKFFQYAYKTSEFEKMLSVAGLRVIEKQGYAVLWGLYEIPFLNLHGASEFAEGNANREKKEDVGINIEELLSDQPVSFLKRLVVCEDHTVPILGLGVRFMRWASANMMMYVCVKS